MLQSISEQKEKNQNKMNTSKRVDTKKVVVVGTGDKAHGISHIYQYHSKKDGWCNLIFTEPLLTLHITCRLATAAFNCIAGFIDHGIASALIALFDLMNSAKKAQFASII
mmetsp:Transcript_20338/g.36723  ORF Transcript_20338/g.36723 Transcript_20338/m.36723 type:complete len:110 (-) Transcript_20338:1080-1409(-)